jgi:hypothetical protein
MLLGRPQPIQGSRSSPSQKWLSTTIIKHEAPSSCKRADKVLVFENKATAPETSKITGTSPISARRAITLRFSGAALPVSGQVASLLFSDKTSGLNRATSA